MEYGYDLDPDVLKEGITVLCGTSDPLCLQIHVKNEKELFVLIEALFNLYRKNMENKQK
jgi:hypothetical protein